MAQSFFRFKEFTIYHDQCAMKVGTDAVLIGAWTEVKNTKNILDIGTGSGIISLMLAQRNSCATIKGIEIDEAACHQALDNFKLSPFSGRLRVEHTSVQDFIINNVHSFDLIVSNPPYFVNSLKCPDKKRNNARHSDTLSLDELLRCSKSLLVTGGRLALVVPFDLKEELYGLAAESGFHLRRETSVYPTPNSEAKRLLVEFILCPVDTFEKETLTIEIARHQHTEEYIALTKDFYLKM